eukprot:CAMPEP_0115677676 /NCGR_PEP_ID=MMETSP0272-20121206/55350_1 /TAXON_ID=71861 /ORGANISM="Scrippsiella trochoidea, Strain CCMP3099" /LENGTH=44 /DNA_ID= /DNA_START= /DNA_END= /DNA_ORIENTATION=
MSKHSCASTRDLQTAHKSAAANAVDGPLSTITAIDDSIDLMLDD